MPTWVNVGNGDKEKLIRPNMTLWINVQNHKASDAPGGDEPLELTHADALQSLVKFCNNHELCGFRPGTVEVRDPALHTFLENKLQGTDIRVVCRDTLPIVDDFLTGLAGHMSGAPPTAGPLSGNGVTLETMRTFADAAADFFRAEPWLHLCSQDLLRVESPAADPQMKFFTILGGREGMLGLCFLDSKATFMKMDLQKDPEFISRKSLWMMLFEERDMLPVFDDDLWQEHKLPVAAADAYPVVMRPRRDGRVQRPNKKQLAFIEGLLRTLALATEEQIDSGRWETSVPTSTGKKKCILALPDLLDAAQKKPSPRQPVGLPSRLESRECFRDLQHMLEGQQFDSLDDINHFMETQVVGKPLPSRPKETNADHAMALCMQAEKTKGRLRVKLAKQALAMSPDCSDAYILLAEAANTPEAAIDLYSQAIAAAERTLGEDTFRNEVGHFWMIPETRPYMAALLSRAVILESMGLTSEAIADFRELLRLNPNDNQGVRDPFVALLLITGELDEAQSVLTQYQGSAMAFGQWAQAFLSFLRTGPGEEASQHLQKAIQENSHVAKLLLQRDQLPPCPDSFSPGTAKEAAMCAHLLQPVFENTPTLISWLSENT